MQTTEVIRAWKDPMYRAGLSTEEWALVPENPAGMVQLTDEALDEIVGGDSCMCWSCNPPSQDP